MSVRRPQRAVLSGQTWAGFFSSLRRREGNPAAAFIHLPTSVTYSLTGKLGEGQYGSVYSYAAAREQVPAGLPADFCVKYVFGDHGESSAIAALDEVVACGSPGLKGLVPALVIRNEENVAEIAMPLYTGSLGKINKTDPDLAQAVAMHVALSVELLWRSGLAYCDIKPTNVLYRITDRGVALSLGDLGSIVPLGEPGIFSFPPQRSIQEKEDRPFDHVDGITVAEERDLVWGLGALVLSLAVGHDFVNGRFTVSSLKMQKCKRTAFSMFSSEAATAACSLLSEGPSGAACAAAITLAVEAWNGRHVRISHFRRVITPE